MRPWIEPPDVPIPEPLLQAASGSALLAAALARRGLSDPAAARAFLDPAAYTPASPSELPSMDRVATRLETALHSGESILVWGDFDVDGQTATALLVSALRDLGGQVAYHIPVRSRESHGLSLPILKQYLSGSAPSPEVNGSFMSVDRSGDGGEGPPLSLLLTCDTGITAHEAIAYAQSSSVDVLVTDHHALPESLPPAYAILNPHFLPASHPLSSLPGVGVAYKLAEELCRRSGRPQDCDQYLDLVALGIVADVAEQTGETRCLLQRGLALLRSPQRLGLRAIYERADLDPTWLTEEHIGFVLAPRLNALGRLGDANPAVELLTTPDLGRARLLALQIEGLNTQRQLLTSQVLRAALAQLEQDPSLLAAPVIVLAHPAWEAGVIGIVASRLVDRFGKPAVLVCISSQDHALARGSARSVAGVDITAALTNVDRQMPSLLSAYGGHAGAAGFSLDPALLPDFRRLLSRAVASQQAQSLPPGESEVPPVPLQIDATLALSALTQELVSDLERMAPFGPGNPPLVLSSRGLLLKKSLPVGRDGEHLSLTVDDGAGASQQVIWWNGADFLSQAPQPDVPFDLAYTARLSTFRGQRGLQLEFVDYRLPEGVPPVSPPPLALEIIDYRLQSHPLPILQRLVADSPPASSSDPAGPTPLLIWAEGDPLPPLPLLCSRRDLSPCATLVIWTSPPSRQDLQSALDKAHPRQVVLIGVDPLFGSPQAFLQRLAGLVKYALQKEAGRLSLPHLATALAHRQLTALTGVQWLAAKGHLSLQGQDGDYLLLSPFAHPDPGRVDPAQADLLASQLYSLLDETRAYRLYFKKSVAPLGKPN